MTELSASRSTSTSPSGVRKLLHRHRRCPKSHSVCRCQNNYQPDGIALRCKLGIRVAGHRSRVDITRMRGNQSFRGQELFLLPVPDRLLYPSVTARVRRIKHACHNGRLHSDHFQPSCDHLPLIQQYDYGRKFQASSRTIITLELQLEALLAF